MSEPELPLRLRVAPEVRRARTDAEHLGAGDGGEEPHEPRARPHSRGGDPRDPLRHLDRVDEGIRLPSDDVTLSRPPALHREDVGRGGVLNVPPAIRGDLRDPAEFPPQVLPQRDSHLARVPGAVRDPGLYDDEGEPLLHPRFRDLVVRDPLRAVVLAQPGAIVAVRLVDELPLRVPEDRQSARVHALPDPEFLHEVEDVAGALDVAPHRRGLVFLPDPVPCREVEHAVGSCHRGSHGFLLGDVSFVDSHANPGEVPRLGGIPSDRMHFVARLPEPPGEPSADEARRPRHEVPHP